MRRGERNEERRAERGEQGINVCVCACTYFLGESEGTAKLLPVTVARPHLHPCVDHLQHTQNNEIITLENDCFSNIFTIASHFNVVIVVCTTRRGEKIDKERNWGGGVSVCLDAHTRPPVQELCVQGGFGMKRVPSVSWAPLDGLAVTHTQLLLGRAPHCSLENIQVSHTHTFLPSFAHCC